MGGDREQGKKWKRQLILQCFVKTSYEAMDFFCLFVFLYYNIVKSKKELYTPQNVFIKSINTLAIVRYMVIQSTYILEHYQKWNG